MKHCSQKHFFYIGFENGVAKLTFLNHEPLSVDYVITKINARALIGQSAMVYCASKLEESVNHSSRVLPTSRLVHQPITHRNLWSIA